MNCPSCGFEERDRLMSSPCPKCTHEWWDTEEYTRMLAGRLSEWPRVVMDIGCGNKGVIAHSFWGEVRIEKGYAVDRHVVKELPPPWERLVMDAEDLLEELGPKSVDFITHCGLLEHVAYDKALRILHVLEQLCRGTIFFTSSAILREVDWKVRQDGNPFHYYKSFWCGPAYEALGYTVDRERMAQRITFHEEVVGWVDVPSLAAPFEPRAAAAAEVLKNRRCAQCDCEPMFWDVRSGGYLCAVHAYGTDKCCEVLKNWIDRKGEGFAGAPFRPARTVIANAPHP